MNLDLRVESLEKKVKELEEKLDILLEKGTRLQDQQVQTTSEKKPQIPQQRPLQEARIPVKQPTPPRDWEHWIARVWLPRIFIVVFLLGVLWGFTAAVNAGIITEPVRCILGAVVVASCIGKGNCKFAVNA